MDLVTAVALSLLPGDGRFSAVATLRSLVSSSSPSEEPWRLRSATAGDIDRALDASGLSDAAARTRAAAERVLDRAAHLGLRLCTFCDAEYPAALSTIPDPPAVLWVRGSTSVLARPAVALVGTRAASRGALSLARELASDLARAGLVVASGLARGIDAAAHEGALESGVTVAVVGAGVDVVYPPEHEPLARRIESAGAMVSEFPPGTAPCRHHFPLRNRLLSGLSRATVVIEAPAKSGALITARYALEQGRDVLAVPGAVGGGRNAGAHALIRDGAGLVESARDILDYLRWTESGPHPAESERDDDPVLAALAGGRALSLDDIVGSTGLPVRAVLGRLTTLEACGRVGRGPGGWFSTSRLKVVR